MSKTSVSPIELKEDPKKEEKVSAPVPSKKDKKEDDEDRKNSVLLFGWKFPFKWFHILTMIGWIIMIGFMMYYIVRQSINYIESMGKPTTSMSLETFSTLALPAITICNWNFGPSDCNACEIRYSGVVDFQRPEGVSSTTPYTSDQYYYKEIEQGGMNYHCYVFNNITDANSPNLFKSWLTGYSGMRMFYFGLNTPTEDEIKKGITRMGFQVSFHEPGTTPDLLSETNYAQPGLDNFFILTKQTTKRLKVTPQNPNLSTTEWTSKNTVLKSYGAGDTGLTVSVTYNTLNVFHIEEVSTASIEGLLGELAGMLGLLMGIDILKIIRGLLEIPLVFREKSTMELWDNFN